MKKTTKILSVVLALIMVIGLAACGGNTPANNNTAPANNTNNADNTTPAVVRPDSYARLDEEKVYSEVLGKYAELSAAAKAAKTDDERFVLYAQAEAYLLDSAVMLPTTTQGGAYAMSRIAYRTVPYVNWGNDDDRWKGVIISSDLITKEERADLVEQWKKAVAGEGTYDPAAYLTSKGHKINPNYKTTFSTAPVTLDTLNTSSQSDTEILVNCTDNLVQYNNLGQMIPAMAEKFEKSADGKTYTFTIRQGAYWFDSEGKQVAEVTAEDFEAGFHHMLDAAAGLEWLVEGVVVGAHEYLNGGSWDDVGYKATDKYTLTVTLEDNFTYFPTMLTYSCFAPICKSFYESRGGVFGIEEYGKAYEAGTIKYGLATDVSSQVYNGAFLLTKLNPDSEITVVKNKGYYDPESVKLDSITWIKDAGENPTQFYADVVKGTYPGCTLAESTGLLKLAREDGNFDKYSYTSDTTSTTYFMGLNVNRGTFVLSSGAAKSTKADDDAKKIDIQLAMLNKNFRKAIVSAFSKQKYNAVTYGEEMALISVRNMYTMPGFVQLSSAQKDADGHEFAAGTPYDELVQYYCDKLGAGIIVKDSVDGWYNPEAAKKYIAAAKEELGSAVNWPIELDVVYYSASKSQVAQANAVKQFMEENLGKENVIINLVETTTTDDFYACGYRASNGEAENADLFYGSGWGPDFGDPCTYLDTFLPNGEGYMTKTIGLF